MKALLINLKDSTTVELLHILKNFNANILYRFTWDVEPIFKLSKKIQIIEYILNDGNGSTIDKTELIEYLKTLVIKPKLMDRSSNQMSVLSSIWEKEVTVELIDYIKQSRI